MPFFLNTSEFPLCAQVFMYMPEQRSTGSVWELWASVWCLEVVLVSGVKNWLGMVVMKLKHSNKANQQSSLMCGTAKIDPHKLHFEIAFVACQQMECVCGFLSLWFPHPTLFLLILPPCFPLFHFTALKCMNAYLMEGAVSVGLIFSGGIWQRWRFISVP